MPASTRRRRRRRDEIEKLVAKFRRSGQTREEFAEAVGVHVNTLYKWVREVPAEKKAVQDPQVAVPVRVQDVAPRITGAIEIDLRNGRTVRVTGKIDKDALREIVEALES